jgi:sugar O-acyltransferase (sialic acid O-acetyltransferase NeuD family)
MKRLIIVGAGGFGRELYAWAGQHPDCGGAWELAGFLDDNPDALAAFGRFAPVHTLAGHKPSADNVYLAGLGMPLLKEKLVAPLIAAGAEFLTFIHPQALVGARVKLGKGVVVCPGAILSVDIYIGDFAMVNLNCTIGHDASLGPWTSLSAQCDITGHVRVADRVFMGSRASVIPEKSVGSRSIVGAGAVVVRDVPPGVTVVGIPARIL